MLKPVITSIKATNPVFPVSKYQLTHWVICVTLTHNRTCYRKKSNTLKGQVAATYSNGKILH